ncbi:16S rRNA (cytosine(1402)-N(4))-methyltransferase RsmH [Patescibacteria group bacterium]|nr:16S rRNA (cytosine(1402)-N(4))-methyltransferase RsmH [Patescibacteria group bacterium]
MHHQPVLKNEVLEYLKPTPGENFIDCTFGFGGHSFPLLEKIKPEGKILGIETDGEVIKVLKKDKLDEKLILVQGNFSDLKKIAQKNNFSPVNGILFDLGFSSWQIEKSGRGFSFQKNEPLDMRLDNRALKTAEQIVNSWPKDNLAKIFREYGEERYAFRIADLIYRSRKETRIETTGQLIEIIRRAVPFAQQRRKIHFATKTFQALRIAVNDELGNLAKAFPQALELLETGGRLAIISFHSLEDRLVKNFFKEEKIKNNLKILTKKPVGPSLEEIRENPRSRSAKMRSAVKI